MRFLIIKFLDAQVSYFSFLPQFIDRGLSPLDAKNLGIDIKKLNYSIPVSTANGRNMAASVILDSIKIGDIEILDKKE